MDPIKLAAAACVAALAAILWTWRRARRAEEAADALAGIIIDTAHGRARLEVDRAGDVRVTRARPTA